MRAREGRQHGFVDQQEGDDGVLDPRRARGREAGPAVAARGGCEGEGFVGAGAAVCGGEQRDGGFQGDAGEGREGDA